MKKLMKHAAASLIGMSGLSASASMLQHNAMMAQYMMDNAE
ncbi:hypothetical protein [Neisseria perflava]|nr:hypothetical protein [Neisseria perflava]MCP1660574.1 hypothetical protein [Neisseria perflava]MCP1772724.1 hypothetical protein [Neisseria perflava]